MIDDSSVILRRLVTFRLQSDEDNNDLMDRLFELDEEFERAATPETPVAVYWVCLVHEAVAEIERLLDLMANPGQNFADSDFADRRPAIQRLWIALLNDALSADLQ
jgi:hypothetical protein